MRSPAAEAVVDPSSVAAVGVVATGLKEAPIVAAEVAADIVAEDMKRLNTASASTVAAAGCSPVADAADSLVAAADLNGLVGVATALPGVGPEAPSP